MLNAILSEVDRSIGASLNGNFSLPNSINFLAPPISVALVIFKTDGLDLTDSLVDRGEQFTAPNRSVMSGPHAHYPSTSRAPLFAPGALTYCGHWTRPKCKYVGRETNILTRNRTDSHRTKSQGDGSSVN